VKLKTTKVTGYNIQAIQNESKQNTRAGTEIKTTERRINEHTDVSA
jgi:hypothetical protein